MNPIYKENNLHFCQEAPLFELWADSVWLLEHLVCVWHWLPTSISAFKSATVRDNNDKNKQSSFYIS